MNVDGAISKHAPDLIASRTVPPLKVLVVEDDLHTRNIIEMVLKRDRMLRYHQLEVLTASDALFRNAAGPGEFAPRPEDRPLTKFELRGQRLGHGVWALIFLRR